jgi:rhodanese-related sulfurtransferase
MQMMTRIGLSLLPVALLCLATPLGCADEGDGDAEMAGDGDGDTEGDGDGDSGDGDGDGDSGDGDGDGDSGDGDGDGDSGDGDGDGDPLGCEGITPEVTEITPDELSMMLENKDFELINVHIPDAGEIPGTDVHITYTETAMLEDHLGGDVGAKAVLYCLTGPMSAIATAALVELGYCRIYDMPAGMVGWEAEGYPVDP